MTAAPTGVKKITVTFNKAVDTTKAVFTVKKGSATLVNNGVTFAADNKSAEIAIGSKVTAGTYTVELSGLKEALTASFEAEDEKLTRFALVNNYLVASAEVSTIASISYKALNQYDEMMAPNDVEVSCSFSTKKGSDSSAPTAKKAGKYIAEDIPTTLAIPGQTGTIVIVDKTTGVNMNETITYQSKAVATTGEFVGIYNEKTERIMDTNLKKGDKTSDYFLLFSFKDQYDGVLDADTASKGGISLNPAAVATDLTVSKNVDKEARDITIDGKDYVKIALGTGTTAGVLDKWGNIATSGSLTLTVVSQYKGVLATPKIVVEEPAVASSFSLGNNEFYSGKDNDLKLEVTDANGNVISDYDSLKKTEIKIDATIGSDPVLSKNADGTGSYIWKISKRTVKNKDEKHKATEYGTLTVYANAPTSGKYTVKSFNVTVKEDPVEWEVTGTTAKTVTSAISSSSLTVDLSTLTYADQYGNEVKFKDIDKDLIQYQIVSDGTAALSASGAATTVGALGKASDLTDDKKIELKTGTEKGTYKLYLRVLNDVNKTKSLDKNNYDIALDLNVVDGTSVDATSDVKIASINDGKHVYAAFDGKITFTGKMEAKAAGQTTGSSLTVPVVVTARVGSKTVVLDPATQYKISNATIDAKKKANTVTNPAVTETKELRVVVNTGTNGETVVVTGSYILSNADSAVKTIESTDDALATVTASATMTAADLAKTIKVTDQYGQNVTTDNASKITYDVKPTGDNAEKLIIGFNNGSDITLTSKDSTVATYSAVVTYIKDGVKHEKKDVTLVFK